MTVQTTIDFGRVNRDSGMKRAEDHANLVHDSWTEKALRYLKWYINAGDLKKNFLTEDVRESSGTLVPEPPSLRAWGSVMMKAAKAGLIKKVGYAQVKNPKANRTPATLWTKA